MFFLRVKCLVEKRVHTKDREMLKSWSIKNFKPIVDSGELQLAPVTVLAGRNSSGKSSLLQSILMIAQTLGSRLLDRPLLPNERIVQLGTYEGILSEIAFSRILELKVGLEMGDEEVKTPSRLLPRSRWDIKSAKFLVRFSGGASNGVSSSAIEASKVIVDYINLEADTELMAWANPNSSEARELHKISFSLQKVNDDVIQHFLENVSPEQRRLIPLSNENSNYLGHFARPIGDSLQEDMPEQYLAGLSHFLPSRFTAKYNIGKRRKQAIERYIHYFFDLGNIPSSSFIRRSVKHIDPEAPISPKLKANLTTFCEQNNLAENFPGQTLKEIVSWARSRRRISSKREIFAKIQELVLQEYLDNEDDGQENLEGLESNVDNAYIENLEQIIEQITYFLQAKFAIWVR